MKRLPILFFLLTCSTIAVAQQLRSVRGDVSFFSSAPIEDITATNDKARGMFDPTTGDAAFLIPIKDFQFKKSLMREHFNENYMESKRFKEASFVGKVFGYVPGKSTPAKAEGDLKIHGVSKRVTVQGTIRQEDNKLCMEAVFPVKVADYGIEIPTLLFRNIAEEVEVTVKFEFNLEGND
jgi:hypothetical protein